MENQKEIKIKLLEEIGRKIKDTGFVAKISQHEFLKKTQFGKYSFHLSFVPHKADMDVTADVALRFDNVEQLFHDNIQTRFLTEKGKLNTFTLGSDLGNITGEGQKRWTVIDVTDVKDVSTSIVEMFFAVGLPYLERYSDVHLVFRVMSTVNPEANLLMAIPVKQATRAIGLAYLLGKEDEFHEIVDEMTAYLAPIPRSGIETFLEFAQKLEQKFQSKERYTQTS